MTSWGRLVMCDERKKKSIRKFERGDVVVVALNVAATLVKLNAVADDENLAVGMRLARHQTQNRFRVFERLRFARRAGVLAIVGQFGTEAQIADSITRKTKEHIKLNR